MKLSKEIDGVLNFYCEEDDIWLPQYKVKENGQVYELNEEELIYYPMLNVPEVSEPDYELSEYGIEREKFLKENRKGTYTAMIIKFTLQQHLIDIDKSALELEERLVEEYMRRENVTPELKKDNMLEWAAKYKSILMRVKEVVLNELIYI